MAKNEPEKKQRWYQLIAQAYKFTKPYDSALLPLMIGVPVIVIGAAVVAGLLLGSTVALVYAIILGVLLAVLGDLFLLTRRFEKVAFERMEGQMGGSLYVAQSIRRGWQFEDDPIAVDQRGAAIVFYGVGVGGIVLLAEGTGARKHVDKVKARLTKVASGVKVTPIYVGTGDGQVPVKTLPKAIRKVKAEAYGRGLSSGLKKDEQEVVRQRLRAMGGAQLPMPKGVDPLRARPDRKGMRGR
ncbi:DUF4191 family protein [Demequina capsici]|uniref:DUF4191 family protein n=1 Tax=Demequina capsici TaxID=3075620 RepID=A0AA96FEB5_9MICO|nr:MULTISPECIES: DUF4191 family protein [unclassified Demequina]WNM25653.1 DUF4191 family protein [Demequina sp. OYTSA14]WNM28548.1 DUF4191 family protein [Demequina sp. PMTSA13]